MKKSKMWPKTVMFLVSVLLLAEAGRIRKQGSKHYKNYSHVRRNASSNFGLWPSAFNLATKADIVANATCGEQGREEFCRMVEGGKGRCGVCDDFSTDPGKRHPIEYAIDGTNKWWQSPALFYGSEYEYVTITIDLKQVYQITDVIIKAANSLRPGTWILERSLDGDVYEPWQYFARSDKECLERFGVPATKGKPHYFTDTEVICTSFYSKLTPMENGEIHTSLMYGRPGANETSPELLQFTKSRYVRLRLMGLRGTVEPLPRWFSQDISKEKRLYYTIRDISIIGHCVCNGHAENCRHNVASGHPECECSHHTCGPNCDQCCPMYNQRKWGPGSSRDARQCLPCNCHGHATTCHYDEDIDKAGLSMDIHGNYQGGGVCDNCTAHTTGVNCERCLPGYFRPPDVPRDATRPCRKCDCDVPGSSGTCVQEGDLAGTCDCLPGYQGERCEMCATGFKGWPKCETCPCDPKGVLEMPDCEGECVCKVNVEGENCDRCKSGHFALRKENPEGCTACFCSDVTTLCEPAFVAPVKIQTLNDWFTTDLNISEVVKPIRDDKGLFSVGNYELPYFDSLYWLAPEPYRANKLEYYGSVFTFKVHWVIMRGDTSGRPTSGPNIILVGSNGLKIAHGNDTFTTFNTTFDIELREKSWYHLPQENLTTRIKKREYVGEPVTRKQFLSVLSNVSHVLLRGTFHTDQIESLLEEATLHSPFDVVEVEKCSCPSGYSGLSCESCAFGYVRIVTNATSKLREAFCGKCDCNGHSESCNPDTGECSCQHNTVGENCERCKPGFYGNPLRGTPQDCKRCACPLENEENNFSPSCQLDYFGEEDGDDGGYVCTQCPKGYTGDHCEICDDGYFGNPTVIGGLCQQCNCNGGPCDRLTGQCLSCKGNTEGWRCERCKAGYYGDAASSNCVSCQCDPLGAISKSCHNETGQCDCKDRFTGRTCNKCETGYGNVTALCTPCACDPVGSTSDVCDPQTGLCECRQGVEGFHCDTCQNLHYGLSESGCKECKCDPQGSQFQACDQHTGKCICKPHYKGAKCDQCETGYWKTNSTSCTPCNCDKHGSTSQICNPNTGQCPCKSGVQGLQCDSCQPRHYGTVQKGCRACDPCDKEGHICHPETGRCVCPPLTTGTKCERCTINAWGYEPGIGCKGCGCSAGGSTKQQCDPVSGRCTCKIGFEGDKCNRCSFGYYGYPNCRNCSCNIAGTAVEECNHGVCRCTDQGCRCKANVEGRRCDTCKKGTFGIDPESSLGCVECFCSGRSSKCSASNYIWDQVRTNTLQKKSLSKCVNKGQCWSLPSKFLGDLIQSYGGYLRISSNTPSKFKIYLTGNGIVLESVTDARGDVKLVETKWKLKFDPPPPKMPPICSRTLTRACLIVVLQKVTEIQIEPKSATHTIKFKEVLLDKMSSTQGISPATSVERCQCPKEYTSSSCQDPNTGYYRYYPSPTETNNYIDRILGVARPCRCNGRSNVCDKQTGHCFNCTNFTTGAQCELCAEGYYRDPSGNCAPCLCPSRTQNFARNCTVTGKKQNHYACVCKEGYSGPKCDKCEDKYWGNPQVEGGSCQKCNCNPFGSEDYRCDKNTGRCQCKPGFTGLKCSECTSPRQVIQDGICTPCDECTQILFYTLDNLSAGLNSTLDLFKNGLGPPWGMLNTTIHRYHLVSKDFEKINKANELIKNANLPELEKKVDIMKRELPKRNEILDEQLEEIDKLRKESNEVSESVRDLDERIDDLIRRINDFGKSQIDTKEALREAKEILNEINNIIRESPSTSDYKDLFIKCQEIFRSVNDIYNNDALNPSEVKTKLNELKRRLSNLNAILDKTDSTAKLAKIKNKQNAKRIAALNRTISQIELKHSVLVGNISEIMRKIEATDDILEEIEKIHRTLSKLNLENATKALDAETPPDYYDTLYAVSRHVKDLQDKIKKYKDLFNFTAEEWKKIDASAAYDNLVKGIEEASKLANEARNMTIDTLKLLYPPGDDSLVDKTNLAQAFSDRLEKRVINLKNLTKEYKETAEELENLKQDILSNGKKNNDLNSVLRSIKRRVEEQAKVLEKLEKSKDDARNISMMMASIEQGLKDINMTMQYEIIKPYFKYLDLVSKDEIAKQMKQIKLTKKELQDINVYLNLTKFDQIKDANDNKFKSTKKSLDSVQDMVTQLKNKIQYAKERVEAVEYGFNPTSCRRTYSVKSDIFRSLEVSYLCENCPLLNLTSTKNEMISIYVENNITYVKWKDEEPKTFTNITKISLQRIGFVVRIKPENGSERRIEDKESFHFDSSSLQLGDLANNSTWACLYKVVLNNQNVGLWKFNQSEGNCTSCTGKGITNDGLEKVFFNGDGYRNVSLSKPNPQQLNFKFTFETFDENSLIFIAQEKINLCSYMALNLVDGKLQFRIRHDNGYLMEFTSEKRYNDGNKVTVQVSLVYDERAWAQKYVFEVLQPVNSERVLNDTTNDFSRTNVFKIRKSDVFVGGVSPVFNRSCVEVDTTSFLGNLEITPKATSQNSLSYGIKPRTGDLALDKAWFSGNGFISLEFKHKTSFNLTFSLKPVNVSDNFIMNIHDLMDIYIENSSLRVKTENDDLTIGCLSVNITHLIDINGTGISVNGEFKNFTQPPVFPDGPIRLYLGSDKNEQHPDFIGSIFDIYYNNKAILFTKHTVKDFAKVKIGRDESLSLPSENKCVKEMQNTERYHRIPDYKTEPQAFKFGDKPNSYIFINNSFTAKKNILEFQFRTFYPNGVLFLASFRQSNRPTPSHVIFDIQGGDLRLRVQGHRAKIMNSTEKVNNGDWHYVQMEQIPGKKKWRLIAKLDKKWKLKDRVPKNTFQWELYMGGIPHDLVLHKRLKNELHPFRGCIRSLKINKNLQLVKNNNNVIYKNIGQCFQHVEEGAYFGGDAYAIYKEDFKVNKFLELSFEFKTGESNGILLSVSSAGNSPALSVELQNGAVVMTIDMGNGVISRVTNSPHSDSSLANNEWHNITALYSSSELTVNVDGVRKSWVQSDVNSLMDEIEAPLYVGGLPTHAPSGTLKIKENFRGCIRKFKIEDNIMDWTDMKELNNVQLNSCLA